VIAGLIQEQTKQNLDGVPGAKDIPVLGALFRSRDFQNDETELVVIVTPYLVDPTDPQGFRDPDRGYVTARDARTILFGKLNDVYAVPGSSSANTPAPRGASGFIID
jgi:pilus assembly protein CpaC